MTTTADIAGVLAALEADATDALAWAKLSDWLEEVKPGAYVECDRCAGWGHPAGRGGLLMASCPVCHGKGRLWVPNKDIARCREVPGLLAGEGAKVPTTSSIIPGEWYAWTHSGNRAAKMVYKGSCLPHWLWSLLEGDQFGGTLEYWRYWATEADALAAAARAGTTPRV